MDSLLLARWQFGITTVYHFFFVPLTLGLSILIAIMETLYVRTGKDVYKQMTLFWGKLFLINFAVGVVTGIVQEFQFGLNWSDYSRFVGDVFGAPLAIEALLAFFLESTFLGIWIFGWDRISKRLHLAAIWLVAIGSNLSALWILIANSFMQEPVGYVLRNGRAEMTDFFALLTNPHVLTQFPHVLLSGLATAGFFVVGISAYRLMRPGGNHGMFKTSFKAGSICGLIGALLLIPVGHAQTQHLVQTQPMKIASAEALWESEKPASMSLFTIGNEPERRDVFSIKVPSLLSWMAYGNGEEEVKGIKNLQADYEKQFGAGDYVPPVAVSYWTFRIMIGAGLLMVVLGAINLLLMLRDRVQPMKTGYFKLLTLAIFLPYLANITGWLLAELGRQPWIVYGLMRTSEGVSPVVPPGMVIFSVIAFTVLYGVLMIADIYLIMKTIKISPGPVDQFSPAKAF